MSERYGRPIRYGYWLCLRMSYTDGIGESETGESIFLLKTMQ